MARKYKKRKSKVRKLYPNGWPSNVRAVLYLNNKRRDSNYPPA